MESNFSKAIYLCVQDAGVMKWGYVACVLPGSICLPSVVNRMLVLVKSGFDPVGPF